MAELKLIIDLVNMIMDIKKVTTKQMSTAEFINKQERKRKNEIRSHQKFKREVAREYVHDYVHKSDDELIEIANGPKGQEIDDLDVKAAEFVLQKRQEQRQKQQDEQNQKTEN